MTKYAPLALVLFLAGCAAAPPTPCQRQCNPMYDSCMDVTGVLEGTAAINAVQAQCQTAHESCVKSCQRSSAPN